MNRTVNVVRLQLVSRKTYIWIPLLLLGAAFALSLAIYVIIDSAGAHEPKIGMGAQAPLWYFFFVGVQALTLTFPFSQALSVTRREYFLGTLLTALMTAIGLAVLFMIGGMIEIATNGWGVDGWFFSLPWIWERGVFAAGLFYFVVAMLFFVVGFWTATIYRRFGALWLAVVLVGLGVLLVVAVLIVSRLNAWASVFEWFVAQGALGLSLWGLLLIAALAVGSFFTLRRAVP